MKHYVRSIDALRVLSILAVIVTHTSTRTLEAANFNLAAFLVSIFLNQIARFAVPLFFIISGFVLELNYMEKLNYFSYLKKRAGRIVIPYVFWSLIYYFLIYRSNHDNLIKVLLTGDASYQLYFIPTLCIFYLAFPLFHKIYKIISNKYVTMSLLVIQLMLLYHDYFVKIYRFEDPIRITFLSFFFFIIGMIASHNIKKIKNLVIRWKYFLASGAVLSGLYVFWEGFHGFLTTGNYWTYYETWRPSVLIYTLILGLALFHLFEKTRLQTRLVETLSRLSFLVFFVHVIVLETFWSVFGKSLFGQLSINTFGKIIFDMVFFVIVALVSLLSAFIIHKVPKLYRLTG